MTSTESQHDEYSPSYFEDAISNLPAEYQDIFVEDKPIQSYNPLRLELPKPTDYQLLTYDKEGRPKGLDRSTFIDFLMFNLIIRVGKQFRKFDGRRYVPISEEELEHLVYRASHDCDPTKFVPRDSEVKDVVKSCRALLARPILLPPDLPDYEKYADQPLVAFQNGIYNMETHEMLPFTPYLPVFHYIRADFDPTVEDAPARKVIEDVIPNPQTRDFFFEMVGYILFEPTMNPPAIFTLYGPAETGKSALATMIENLVGLDSVTHMNMRQLTARFGPADLEGKLLNVCKETGGESANKTDFNGELLKNMSSGEQITVERKGQQQYEIIPTAKTLFCTNAVPDFGDDSSGLYRRLYIIPCRQSQNKKDRIYDQLLEPKSLTWIVNKAYQGYQIFKANGGFTQSPQMDREKQYFKSQNSMMDFLQTVFQTDNKDDIRERIVNDAEMRYTAQLYGNYSEYTRMALSQPLSRKKFVEKIRNEFNLDIVNEGVYLPDGRHTTRDKYVKAKVI